MRRDLDLIRDILIDIEENISPMSDYYYHYQAEDRNSVANALELMCDRGLIKASYAPLLGGHPADFYGNVRLTWEGCDFLDSVRDEEIWRQTKSGAKAAGGFTFDLVKALAKGLLKKKIEDHTGVSLDI